ncbi:YkvA family protein [Ferrovibrio sp.]|uniref:YkvA family protein n=1 Tax=Ferrovibrio sp. TaxID=1917215 RepID=UPI0035AF6F68
MTAANRENLPEESAGALEPDKLAAEEARLKPQFRAKLQAVLGRLPWLRDRLADLLTAYYCAIDPATPARAKATLLGALGYFVLPLDAVPDMFLALGYTDDLAVLLLAMRTVQAHITQQHRDRAQQALEKGDIHF